MKSFRSTLLAVCHLFVAAASAGVCPGAAHAGEIGALWGADRGYHDLMLSYDALPFWTDDFAGRKVDVHLETSGGRATAPGGASRDALWHVGLTPTARYWFTPLTCLEIGIGANVFSGVRLGDKVISTAFQFGDSIGIVHRAAGSPWTLGLRFTHYSNADIKRPNPGQNYLQLRVGYVVD